MISCVLIVENSIKKINKIIVFYSSVSLFMLLRWLNEAAKSKDWFFSYLKEIIKK